MMMYINQKNLIRHRRQYGFNTIKEVKALHPDRIEERRGATGYRTREYLFSVDRLRQTLRIAGKVGLIDDCNYRTAFRFTFRDKNDVYDFFDAIRPICIRTNFGLNPWERNAFGEFFFEGKMYFLSAPVQMNGDDDWTRYPDKSTRYANVTEFSQEHFDDCDYLDVVRNKIEEWLYQRQLNDFVSPPTSTGQMRKSEQMVNAMLSRIKAVDKGVIILASHRPDYWRSLIGMLGESLPLANNRLTIDYLLNLQRNIGSDAKRILFTKKVKYAPVDIPPIEKLFAYNIETMKDVPLKKVIHLDEAGAYYIEVFSTGQ